MMYFVQVPYTCNNKFSTYVRKNNITIQRSTLQFAGSSVAGMYYVTMDDQQALVMKLKLDYVKIIKPVSKDKQ